MLPSLHKVIIIIIIIIIIIVVVLQIYSTIYLRYIIQEQ